MSPGATFERVYLALKAQLTGGRWPPGDRLEPSALSGDLIASITPVRDALHRLVGERLVEAPRHDGFRVPASTEAQLRDLYDWNEALLELALHARARAAGAPAPPAQPQAALDTEALSAAGLFREIARGSGNPEHLAAVESVNDRLAAIRLVESLALDEVKDELAQLKAAWTAAEPRALRRALRRYHQRRKQCVDRLISASRQRGDDRPG